MSLLTIAFEVRDTLRDALNIPAFTCSATEQDQYALHVQAPSISVVLQYDHDKPVATCSAYDKTRTFSYSRNNLIGWLGLPEFSSYPYLPRNQSRNLPATKKVTGPTNVFELWIKHTLSTPTPIDFGWDHINPFVTLSGPLGERSNDPDDQLRNPLPYQRLKVFCDRSRNSMTWHYAVVLPNGRDLGPVLGTFKTEPEARAAAETYAFSAFLLPARIPKPATPPPQPRLLGWATIWNNDYNPPVHRLIRSDGSYVEIAPWWDTLEDDPQAQWAVTPRNHDGSEHAGTTYHPTDTDAFKHALILATPNT